jgi:DNA-binding IclR family transcriptional regulator
MGQPVVLHPTSAGKAWLAPRDEVHATALLDEQR